MEKGYQPQPEDLNDILGPDLRQQVDKSIQEGYGDTNLPELPDQASEEITENTEETEVGND